MAPPDAISSQGRRPATAHAGDAISHQRQLLRRELQSRRAGLSPGEQAMATAAIVHQLLRWPAFRRAQRIASYYSVASEVCTREINGWLENSSKQLYLPCLPVHRLGRLLFREVTVQTQWCMNAYRIPEPKPSRTAAPTVNPTFIDVILVPLVGFDELGNRMGMGAGFYDRSLAFRRSRQVWQHPRLVGLAYACQQVDRLPTQSWDVPLDVIITEQRIIDLNSAAY